MDEYIFKERGDTFYKTINKDFYKKIYTNIYYTLEGIKYKDFKDIEKEILKLLAYYTELSEKELKFKYNSLIKEDFTDLHFKASGGFATIWNFDNQIVRIVIRNKNFEKINYKNINLIPYFIKYEILKNSSVSKLLVAPNFVKLKTKHTSEKLYCFIIMITNIIDILYNISLKQNAVEKETIDITEVLKQFNSLLKDEGKKKLLFLCIHEIVSKKIKLNLFSDVDLNRLFGFFKDANIDFLTADLILLPRAIGDVYNIEKITRKKKLKFLENIDNLKLLYLQISLILYNINIIKKFIHNDLKLDNVLVFNNTETIELEKKGNIKYNFIFTDDVIFKLNDFDLAGVNLEMNKLNKHFDRQIDNYTWLSDLVFLTNSYFTYFSNLKLKNTSKWDPFIIEIHSRFRKNKKLSYDKRLEFIEEDEDDINNLSDFINSDFFEKWRKKK